MFGKVLHTTLLAASSLTLIFSAADCRHRNAASGVQPDRAMKVMKESQTGTWGGEHIGLEVSEQGATVEYDCAHGTIDQKIVTDAGGNFNLRGPHVREHGGPVRKGETEDSPPAAYKGQIKGDTMTLTVTETDTGETVGTFTLPMAAHTRVLKCR